MKTIIAGNLPIFRGTCSFCNALYSVEPDDVEYDNQFNPGTDHPFIEVKCITTGCKQKVTLHKTIHPKFLYKNWPNERKDKANHK